MLRHFISGVRTGVRQQATVLCWPSVNMYGRGHRGGGGNFGRQNNWRSRHSDAGEGASHYGSGHGDHRGNKYRRRGGSRERTSDGSLEGDRDGGNRPPPGLRGREIGMWYARRGKARKEQREKQERPVVAMDAGRENHIRNLLDNIQATESYNDIASEEQDEDFSISEEKYTDRTGGGAAAFPPEDYAVEGSSVSKVEEDMGEETDVPSMTAFRKYAEAEDDMALEDATEETDGYDGHWECRERDFDLDQRLKTNQMEKLKNKGYQKMLDFRKKLPSYEMREKILETISSSQVLVISGETGCGKTTQVPQFILDDYIEKGIGSQCSVICTQPRRISAISVAERVSSERSETCGGGNSVGYQIRLEAKSPRRQGSILFCTTGIVLKFLESDSLLERATHLVIDEIHERDLQSDFLMIILKDIIPRRSDLKVILMSATLNAEMFSEYFNGCPMLNIPGYTFPVKEYHLEDVIELLNYQPSQQNTKKGRPRGRGRQREEESEERWNFEVWCRNLKGSFSDSTIKSLQMMDFAKVDVDLIALLIRHIVTKKEDGAILVFVPGWEEISKLHKLLQSERMFCSNMFRIIPLHSLMPTVNQKEVFEKPPPGVRKIIIATNIAETSITIDDVVYVVDCGKIKVKDFQPKNNLSTLEAKWVSKANAKQRRGRAGRVQPGICYHLYTSLKGTEIEDYLPPEILRTRLEELCLHIKLLKLGKIEPFVSKAMQRPSMESLHRAIITLQNLNALDKDENLLPLGYHLARMPVDPHTGKMILFGAMFCCLSPILTVAASLSFKDAFTIPLGKEEEADRARKELSKGSKSDHIMLINAFKGWERSLSHDNDRNYCWHNFLSPNTLRLLRDMKGQLADLLYDLGFISSKRANDKAANIHSENLGLVKAVLCAGLYPNVAKVAKCPKPNAPPYKMVSLYTKKDGTIHCHPKSVNARETYFESKWMVFYHKLKTTKIYVHDCSMVSPYPLLFFGGDIDIGKDGDQDIVAVDDWIVFKASPRTAQLVKDLRKELDRLLEHKIKKPGVTNWNTSEKEGALMRAISDLITTEDHQYQPGSGRGPSYRSRHH